MSGRGQVSILVERTKQELNIDPYTLPCGSHKKIFVSCSRCGEEFTRERRLLHQRHACPIHLQRPDGVQVKWCYKCKLYLPVSAFSRDTVRHDGFSSCCADCSVSAEAVDWAKNNMTDGEFIELLGEMGVDIAGRQVRLECKLLDSDAQLPIRSRTTDAGYDVSAIQNAVIPAGGVVRVNTGIALAAPAGYYYSIDGRSSLWMKGIIPFRGIVDATYTGPLIVVLMNTSSEPYQINKGDRIAQLILHRILHCDIAVVTEFSPYYNQRGTNGFGSTGR